MPNRRKHANAVPVASLVKWIVAAFFVGVAGLSYVYCKNQLHATANEIKAYERQISDIDTQIEIMNGKISSLSSRLALQRRLNEGVIKLIPISNERIVRLNTVNENAPELQPVANRGSMK